MISKSIFLLTFALFFYCTFAKPNKHEIVNVITQNGTKTDNFFYKVIFIFI